MTTSKYTINGTTYILYSTGRRIVAKDHFFLSTDEKPIEGVHNSETGVEMDTGIIYIFDEEVKTWYKI